MDPSKFKSGTGYCDSDLYHYGVLGMKWGVRKGRTKEAYSKASKKLSKLSNKVIKYENKAKKKMYKADELESRFLFSNPEKASQLRYKARIDQSRADRTRYRAVKWLNAMDKNLPAKMITKNQRDLGKAYVAHLSKNAEINKARLYY